jgi:hypothetical protein
MEMKTASHSERLDAVESAQDAFREAVWKCVLALLSASGLALLHAAMERLTP